uniref:SFRICE_012539 n=1 Tax=Spodoptera frugiperda TaxID=7108 RepID=A0A2H1W604_SPOFR
MNTPEVRKVSSFCEAVMLAKEEAGRVREQTSSRPSRRERHSGRRGSRDDLRPPHFKQWHSLYCSLKFDFWLINGTKEILKEEMR